VGDGQHASRSFLSVAARSRRPVWPVVGGRWWNIPASPIRWLLALAFTLSAHPGPKER